MKARTSLVALALAGLCVLPTAAGAAPRPDLEVRVADPVPTGQAGTYGIRLKATVLNDGTGRAGASRLRFALSRDRRLDRGDTLLPLERTDALAPGSRDAVDAAWKVPDSLEPGIYHVIACADAGRDVAERNEKDNCRVAGETVAVTEPGGDTTAQAGGPLPGALLASGPPKTEYFPEQWQNPEFSTMKVSAPFGCPASLHGQGDGRCVWVTTLSGLNDHNEPDRRQRSDFWYCPPGYGFPFEVALGFDPLWRDDGTRSTAFVETVAAKKWTPYQSLIGRRYYPSYGAPSELRGYVSIDFNGDLTTDGKGSWDHRASYVCSDRRATSMLP